MKLDNLVLAIMCKNEEKRITVSFDSVKDYIKTFFIFDTGSTDNTIEVIEEYCKKNNIKLFLKRGTFVDFSVSRNELLQFVDDNSSKDTYVLLLDTNDEMQNMNILEKFITTYKGPCTGFHLRQKWWTGSTMDTYLNVRLVKSGYLWRYKCVVHEYIMCPALEIDKKPDHEVVLRIDDVIVFQDRTKDDDKSAKRFFRDKEMLYKEYLKDPTEPRTLFYLAQTCSCLGQVQEAYNYYLQRIKVGGFWEEVYHSFFRLGEASQSLKHDWEESFMWYMKAFQHSQRVEPLNKIVDYYRDNSLNADGKSEWHTAYMFASMACKLTWPSNQILFINKRDYTYYRWHLLGITAYWAGRYEEGKKACIVAIEAENRDIDKNNLKHYLIKELEMLHDPTPAGHTLIATAIDNNELRTPSDFEPKHNISDILPNILSSVIIERKTKNEPINDNIVEEFINRNKIIKPSEPKNSSNSSNSSGKSGNSHESNERKNKTKQRLQQKLANKQMLLKTKK